MYLKENTPGFNFLNEKGKQFVIEIQTFLDKADELGVDTNLDDIGDESPLWDYFNLIYLIEGDEMPTSEDAEDIDWDTIKQYLLGF